MIVNEEFLKTCQGIVKNCGVDLLIVNLFGEIRVYLTHAVTLKNREVRYHEVRDAQDITMVVKQVGMSFAVGMNNQILMDKTKAIPMESFKFGTDDFMWLTDVKESRWD